MKALFVLLKSTKPVQAIKITVHAVPIGLYYHFHRNYLLIKPAKYLTVRTN